MAAIALGISLGANACSFALDPSLNISQYGHTTWKIRDGFSAGTALAMTQTPDGYLWLASDGLFRSDGIRFVRWEPPAGQRLPNLPYSLVAGRDGTLWIGTYAGIASWKGDKLTQYPEVGPQFITSLLEDREGTVWAGTMYGEKHGQLCAIRNGLARCYGQDGIFGGFVWNLTEDSSGALWVGAESGVWRWKPGPPQRFPAPGMGLGALTQASDGRLIVAMRGAGLRQIAGDKLVAYPIRSAANPNALVPDHDIDSNKLLRDRDGGIWIGTDQRGLLHVHDGRADVFTTADGLSGNIIAGIFEDREGDIWVSTSGGLDRFRSLPVTTVSSKEGLSSDNTNSVVVATDGSIWIATRDGLTRLQNGRSTIFRKADGLPDDMVESLYQDDQGRIWAFTASGLACFEKGRIVAVPGIPSTEVYSMTGDNAGNLWLSGNRGLSHMRDGRLVEHFAWSVLGRWQQAKIIVADRGGIWLGFWMGGGVEYFKDGQVQASYKAADGLADGPVAGLRVDRDGAIWTATQEGGVSRIKDGRITTLASSNGLPCDRVHWTSEDGDRSLWLYTVCGLVRIARSQWETWIIDPKRRVEVTVWDAADGPMPLSAPSSYGPTFANSTDDKLWYVTREDIQLVDPHHLAFNKLSPPVHIERVTADHTLYWQSLPGVSGVSNLRLPAHTRDLVIDYTALSLTAPEKVHFKYKLEGQDPDWREVINVRQAQYSNLPPRSYRFRVIACNNSGVWNEQGDAIEFTIAPAYYQTHSFRALCALAALALLWVAYRLRVRQLHREFALTLEARVSERTSIARELHDTLLQSGHGLLLRLQIISQLLPDRPLEAKEQIETTIDRTARAITEGRDAVQGLRDSMVQTNDLAKGINTLGEELAADPANPGSPAFRVTVEGDSRELHPILRDEIYRIAGESLRNAFRHAHANQIEVEIRYDDEQFRLRVRDDGKGIDPAVLSAHAPEGHFGLAGMRERAKLIGGKLVVWSEVEAGAEVELRIPAASAYVTVAKRSWISELLIRK
jgi:signal transduction histidine kinase/ligand-binding sensor domain-containing protein